MQTKNHILLGLLGLLLLGGLALTVTQAFSGDADIPTVSWDLAEEEPVADPEDELDPLRADPDAGDPLSRSAVDLGPEDLLSNRPGERIAVTLRGRVVDEYAQPVAGAKVSLQIGRGGRRRGFERRRIPDPVVTAEDGTFAFRGEAFRVLRVTLLVLHDRHAPGIIDRNLGEVQGEIDLGDLVVTVGGGVLGRVTDLQGNGIAGATVELVPQGSNPLRWIRDRDEILPERTTDQNGYYRLAKIVEGDYRVQARASRHQRGGSPTFTVEERRETGVPDIRLGPGYELEGTVYGPAGEPVENALVEAVPQRGGTSRARSTRAGRFFLDHLPGVPLTLRVRADDLLTWEREAVDPTSSGVLVVQMQDGLRITGVVTDAVTGEPVTSFAARARRVRDLPRPEAMPQDGPQAEVERLRQALLELRRQELDRAETRERMARMQSRLARLMAAVDRERALRASRRRGGERFDAGGRGWRAGDPGEPETHPGGAFALTGLQEGVYVVDIGSPDHVRTRTGELELRAETMAPHLEIALLRGFTVAGSVVDSGGLPIGGARVELRVAPEDDPSADRPRGMLRRSNLGARVVDARTDPNGAYELRHAPEGRFLVRVSASGFAEASSEPFELRGDLRDLEIVLGNLGALTGHVTGIPPDRSGEAMVAALQVQDGAISMRGGRPMQSVAPDGSYRFDELEPGAYLVRAFLGSPGDFFRSQMALLGGEAPAADVRIEAGRTAELDLVVEVPEVGSLEGTVTHNFEPATGYRVTLQPVDEDAGGRRRVFRRLGDTVSDSGRYALENVPAGDYELTVATGRRGGVMYRERVTIVAFQEQMLDIAFQTGALEGTFRDPEDGQELDGNALWLPNATTPPEDFGSWRRENRVFSAPVRGGRFRFDALPVGAGLLIINARGRERSTATAFVSGGSATTVEVRAGPPR